jgi:hypothetical protein
MLQLLNTVAYCCTITFGCFSGWRPDAVVRNATIAYKCLQLNIKFVDVFLGGGLVLDRKLNTASNCSIVVCFILGGGQIKL